MLQGLVSRWVGRSGESCMNLSHAAVTAEDERGRPAIQVVCLWDLRVEFFGRSSHEHGISNVIPRDEGVQAGGVLQLIGFFKGEVDDFQALAVELLVQTHEEGSLIVAVWAPRTADSHDDNLAIKLWIRIRHQLAREIREAKGKPRGGILDTGLFGGFGGGGQIFLAGLSRSAGYEVLLIVNICAEQI